MRWVRIIFGVVLFVEVGCRSWEFARLEGLKLRSKRGVVDSGGVVV